MRTVLGRALVLGFALLFAMGAASAADRSVSLLPGTDLPGSDYSILKDVTLDACQAECLNDRVCRAFTYNERAGWCFLKGDVGLQTPFAGATTGIVDISPLPAVTDAVRQAELPFPGSYMIDDARRFAEGLRVTDPPPPGATYADLVAGADAAVAQSNPAAAMIAYRQALAINDNDPALWLRFANLVQQRADAAAAGDSAEVNRSYEYSTTATSAALNAFLLSETVPERASALAAIGRALQRREMWREAIATYRASIALVDDGKLQTALDKVVAEHGFRMVSNEVDVEAASPRICAVFSDTLPGGGTDLSGYVSVEDAPQVAVEVEDNQICLEGVENGRRYHITLRSGLPSAQGETLRDTVELNVFVPDRPPFVGFANNAYVLPAGLGAGLPITSVNARTADIVIYRIGDRAIAQAVRNGIFMGTLDGYSAEDVADQYGELSWEGQVDFAEAPVNTMTTTAIPVNEAIADFQPGAYVITAKVAGVEEDYWREIATQWFIVTDLGLTTVAGEDGVHAFVRALGSADPVANAKVRLVARNNEILGEAVSDADGRADFDPGLARGTGGRAPQLLVAETDGGDYAFLDVSGPAFDLTDRGVEGRPSPGPLDLFMTTERGVYRPAETVYITALLRDLQAKAVIGLPLTLEVERPDGVVSTTQLLSDAGQGGYFYALQLLDDAMRGSWNARLYADPQDQPLNSATFLVEDFEPERLAFDITAEDAAIDADAITPVDVAARYLYGATAPGLSIEADAVVRPTSSLRAYPGYTFGRADDTVETTREPLGTVGVTDEQGNAVAEISLPELQATTRPLEAQLILRLVDANGRTVERTLSRPVLATGDRIGVRPQFESTGLAEGSEATFDVIAVAPTGETIDKAGLTWSLSRIETNYQWYRNGGTWKWEAITTTRRVANGTVDAKAAGAVTIAAPVDWGRYLIEIESAGAEPTSTSYEFYAGYYYADAGSNTPDVLQVALDKPAYRVGETATLRLDPQFAGTALVMVVDDRIIDMVAVPVPAEGTSIALPVTDDWGPGAYVTAMLYRPSSDAEKRMPARALGLAYADVEPGDRVLDVAIDAVEVAQPRQPLTVKIALGNVAAGQTAYVAVAAVDLGILNLTNFKAPAPDEWYFGQRQLGVEFRDLYGQLIDPTQGLPGVIRSGGDGGASRLGNPPPTSVLVAQHSGIVEVGADGTATVTFDMPDFAGTVRVMAMAWTGDAVGHAVDDVIVRDPVVVTMSPPRFLRLDDQSRLLVEINNVSGAAGTYRVELTTGDGLATDQPDQTVDLATGARIALNLGLTGTAIGDNELRLAITAPNGDALVKELTLGVRAASTPQTTSRVETIEPGGTLSIAQQVIADLVPHSGTVTLAVGPIARLDVPGLLTALDRYPYGCAEQISSRALPLLYLNEVAQMIGLGDDDALDQRVRDSIANLLSKQTSTGSFGLWGPFSGSDLWLDSYVTEFLLRARDEGYEVPEQAMSMALDSLSNQLSYASDFTMGGEDVAYALYDLSRAGRAAIGDLRYYLEARLGAFATPLAKAQLGAALALYGDRTRSAEAFAAAVEALKTPDARNRYRSDYGSRLRDTAAVLALAAEFTPSGVDLTALTGSLADLRDLRRYTSTQEDAWTLMAAAALARETGDGSITIDGEPLTGAVYRRFTQEEIEANAVTLVNTGNRPTEAKISVFGIPATPPAASSDGFTITREYFLPDGTPADLTSVSQNDRFVVVLRMRPDTLGSGQYLAVDPLPAGFEIENPNLSAGGVSDLNWLTVDAPSHVESRTDQFVAAFRYSSDTAGFSAAYMVRAVSPGNFVLPGATVEDMYRPDLRANTDAGSIEIVPTGTP